MLQVTTRREETSVGRRLHPKHRLMRLCTPCTSSPSIPSFSSTCTPSEIERPQQQGSHPSTWDASCSSAAAFASTLAQYEESPDTIIFRARRRATSQMHNVRFDGNTLFSSVERGEKQVLRGGVATRSFKSFKQRRGIVAR